MKCSKETRETCLKYSSGTRMPPNHDVRTKNKCAYEIKGECKKLGPSCSIEKAMERFTHKEEKR